MLELEYIVFATKCLPFTLVVLRLAYALLTANLIQWFPNCKEQTILRVLFVQNSVYIILNIKLIMEKYLDKISTSKQKETAQQKPKRKYKDVQIIFFKATFLLL